MDPDVAAVVANERRLHAPEVRGDAAAVRALLHPDFVEFGASGTVWDRRTVVQATGGDTTARIETEDVRPVRLGPDAILLTYTAHRGDAASLRTSVWVRSGDDWLMLHHHGTRLPGDARR